MQLRVNKANNLGRAVGYLSGEAWKPDRSVMKATDHQKDGKENSGDFSSLPESGGNSALCGYARSVEVQNKIFLPRPIQPPHSSPLEPCSPSQEYQNPSCCIRALGERADGMTGGEHGTWGRDRKGGLGKVSCPGSYRNKVKTAERPGVTFKVSQKKERFLAERAPGEHLIDPSDGKASAMRAARQKAPWKKKKCT